MGVESRKKKETFNTAYFLVNNTPFPKCSNTDRNKNIIKYYNNDDLG